MYTFILFSSDPNGEGEQKWPKFTLETQQHYRFDHEDSIGERLYAKEYAFWRKVVPALMDAINHPAHEQHSMYDEESQKEFGGH